jgi:hypothetical protein
LAAPNGFDLDVDVDDDGYEALPAFVLLGLSCRRGRTGGGGGAGGGGGRGGGGGGGPPPRDSVSTCEEGER